MNKILLVFVFLFSVGNIYSKDPGPVSLTGNGIIANDSSEKSDVTIVSSEASNEQGKSIADKSNRFQIDEIVCTVHGQERTHIFCDSDTKRQGLGGAGKGSLQELITNELIYQEALHYKLPIDDSIIDNYIAGIQQQNNLSNEEVKKIFKSSGYTMEEGRQELRKMYAVNSVVDMKIRQNLFIPEHEVIAYYDAHPIKREAKFNIQRGFVELKSTDNEKEVESKLKKMVKSDSNNIIWQEPVWFAESDIADSFKFITEMAENQISKPHRIAHGFELYKLTKKKPEHLVPLKKRYREITEEIRRPKFEQLYEQYTKSLIDSSAVIYFNGLVAPAA